MFHTPQVVSIISRTTVDDNIMSLCYLSALGFKEKPQTLLMYDWVSCQILWLMMRLSVMIDGTYSNNKPLIKLIDPIS